MNSEKEFLEAVKAGEANRVKELLKADPTLVNSEDKIGISAILLAKYYGHQEVVEALLENADELNIFEASAVGNEERIAALLKSDADLVNSYSPDGFAPLGLAAFFGHKEILRLLLDHGADANVVSKNAIQVRPLHSAVAHRQPEVALAMAEILLANGAEVDVKQNGGWTPLHQAAAHGQNEMVKLLLKHGANVNANNDDGKTPIKMAQNNGHDETADLLRQHGAK
jgi:ankyrin repeat protein